MAKVKLDKKLFTAKFKRDYVAFSAVALFWLIVLSEVVLAVSVPLYFVRSNLWDLQIARQQLMTNFDAVRGYCHYLSLKTPDAVEEVNLLLWDLNLMANYLRVNEKTLSREEIAELSSDINQIRLLANRLHKDKAFNQPIRLDPSAAMRSIRAEFYGKDGGK